MVGVRGVVLLLLGSTIWFGAGRAHAGPPTADDVARWHAAGTYDDHVAFQRVLTSHRVGSGLAGRALFKTRYACARAFDLDPRTLVEGPHAAFPYPRTIELPSTGTVRILVVPVDFSDQRAPARLTQAVFERAFFGERDPGSPLAPFESMRAYYASASQGRVDVQGDITRWHHFEEKQARYQPPGGDYHYDRYQEALSRLFGEAVTDLAQEIGDDKAQREFFARFDTNNDGDLDCVVLLYRGPTNGAFWWAYQWSFDQRRQKTFGGRTLKQFLFLPVEMSGSAFDPRTLIHEMGHAFGLPDYYDTKPRTGAPGGVGGLDVMGQLIAGNHNAFSRWLLDWIDPKVIGAGKPGARGLIASGATANACKALAVFPALGPVHAPAQELFLVENRTRFGNDGGNARTRGDGILVWHVDATPASRGFKYDNSKTSRKLIRLVRADNERDFKTREMAGPGTYFGLAGAFTPTSVPPSTGYGGVRTGVSMKVTSKPGEAMTVHAGIDDGLPPSPSAPQLDAEINMEAIVAFDRALRDLPSATLAAMWQGASKDDLAAVGQRSLKMAALLTEWASKDGRAAVEALLALESREFQARTFPVATLAWAADDPSGATHWYFVEAPEKLRSSEDLRVRPGFTRAVFAWAQQFDPDRVGAMLEALPYDRDKVGAILGIKDVVEDIRGQDFSTYAGFDKLDRGAFYRDLKSFLLDSEDPSPREIDAFLEQRGD